MPKALLRALPAILAAALLLGSACSPSEAPPPAGKAPQSISQRLVSSADKLKALQARVDSTPDRWLPVEALASGWFGSYRLSMRFEDLQKTAELDTQLRSMSGWVPSPASVQRCLAMHRYALASSDLDRLDRRVVVDQPTRAFILRARGEIAAELGDWAGAKALLLEALQTRREPGTLSAYALFLWRTGALEEADALLAEVVETAGSHDRLTRAWALTQRGLLREEVGLKGDGHFEAALAAQPGYLQALVAQARAAATAGVEGAGDLLADLIDKTGDAELMDNLAQVRFAEGDLAASAQLRVQAEVAWQTRYGAMPLAYGTHLVAHRLAAGGADAQLLALARAEAARRPGSDATALLLKVLLALALHDEAAAVADTLSASPRWSADKAALLSQAWSAAGRQAQADAAVVSPGKDWASVLR